VEGVTCSSCVAVQARGSQGANAWLAAVGVLNAALLDDEVVVVVAGAVVDVADEAEELDGGALTEKSVPVSTVTWAPSSTMDGS
jgi:hypothetical protein